MQAGQNFFTCVQQRAPPVPSSMAAPIPQFSMGGDTSAFSRVSSGQVPPEALPVHDLGFCSHSAGAPHTMVFTACLQKGQSETPSGEAVLHFDPNKPETARVTEPLIPEGGEQLVDMAMLRYMVGVNSSYECMFVTLVVQFMPHMAEAIPAAIEQLQALLEKRLAATLVGAINTSELQPFTVDWKRWRNQLALSWYFCMFSQAAAKLEALAETMPTMMPMPPPLMQQPFVMLPPPAPVQLPYILRANEEPKRLPVFQDPHATGTEEACDEIDVPGLQHTGAAEPLPQSTGPEDTACGSESGATLDEGGSEEATQPIPEISSAVATPAQSPAPVDEFSGSEGPGDNESSPVAEQDPLESPAEVESPTVASPVAQSDSEEPPAEVESPTVASPVAQSDSEEPPAEVESPTVASPVAQYDSKEQPAEVESPTAASPVPETPKLSPGERKRERARRKKLNRQKSKQEQREKDEEVEAMFKEFKADREHRQYTDSLPGYHVYLPDYDIDYVIPDFDTCKGALLNMSSGALKNIVHHQQVVVKQLSENVIKLDAILYQSLKKENTLREEMDVKETVVRDAKDEVAKLTRERDELAKETERLEKLCATQRQLMQTYETENDAYEAALWPVEQLALEPSDTVDGLRNQMRLLEQQCKQSVAQEVRHRLLVEEQVSALQTVRDDLTKELHDCVAEHESAELQNQNLRNTNDALEHELCECKASLELLKRSQAATEAKFKTTFKQWFKSLKSCCSLEQALNEEEDSEEVDSDTDEDAPLVTKKDLLQQTPESIVDECSNMLDVDDQHVFEYNRKMVLRYIVLLATSLNTYRHKNHLLRCELRNSVAMAHNPEGFLRKTLFSRRAQECDNLVHAILNMQRDTFNVSAKINAIFELSQREKESDWRPLLFDHLAYVLTRVHDNMRSKFAQAQYATTFIANVSKQLHTETGMLCKSMLRDAKRGFDHAKRFSKEAQDAKRALKVAECRFDFRAYLAQS